MTASDLLLKNKFLLLLVLFIVLSAFAVDISDLREEPNSLSSLSSGTDANVTAAVINSTAVEPEPIRMFGSVQQETSVEASSIHQLPCGLRAPPFPS
jgi:hypothetical protein